MAAATALLIAGLVSTAVGVVLANTIGTGLGVLGFLLIVAGGYRVSHLAASVRRRLVTRIGQHSGGPG